MGQRSRVVTVTINPAIDQTIAIPNFTAGEVNRVQRSQLDPGGKGVNVASFLSDFGEPVAVTGFLGADNDAIFRRLFEQKGIDDRFIRTAGQTRTGVKVIDEVRGQTTDINFPGETPSPGEVKRLFEILAELGATHDWFVLAGSIPAGVPQEIYRDMVAALAGSHVVLDTSGEGLRLALAAAPSLIKPNVAELEELVGERVREPEEILRVARALARRHGIGSVVVSRGSEGAIFVEGERAVWAAPPPVAVKSTVGAGDAMVAGIVAGRLRGLALEECARLATAFSLCTITSIGSGLPPVEEVRSAMETVTVREL